MVVLAFAVVELRGEGSPDGPYKQDHRYGKEKHGYVSACGLPEEHGEKQGKRNRGHEEPAESVKAAAPYEYPGKQVRNAISQYSDPPAR
jgi:hypothetical protein